MSSPHPHRRRRSEVEDDEDADLVRASGGSTPSDSAKRPRTNVHHNSESPEPDESHRSSTQRRHAIVNGYPHRAGPANPKDAGEVSGAGEFQPGALVRVKLTNFVTYENAEFFPGPNLNMVIGPNGTGKSSLVCAICLGLGWGPKHLGRAGEVGEFVKHGMADATIEIELQRRPKDSSNPVVRVRIIRDGNNREWWLNNKKTSLKAIQSLTQSLCIQIDNLCQFLPQDKVSEFAALSPVELLQQTQRAAAPEEMLEMHEKLKQYRRDQKALVAQTSNDKEQLETLEHRQDGLRADVQRLEERNQIQEKVTFLKKTVPFVEYKIARNEHIKFKDIKKKAQERLKIFEAQLGPTLQSIERKKAYHQQIDIVVKERKKALLAAERAADDLTKKMEGLEENIRSNEQKVEAEIKTDGERKRELSHLQRKLTDLKAKRNEPAVEFNAADFNDRVRAKEHEDRDAEIEIQELLTRDQELKTLGRENRVERDSADQELAAFDTQEGQQMNKLERLSAETAMAWKWVQENADQFEHEVYGPPLISCSIKDQRYTDLVEASFRRNDFLTITTQSAGDFKKLQDQLYGTMRLADITLKRTDGLSGRPPLSQNEMQRFGFEGWAIDYIEGPGPVLAMLCTSMRLHLTAVALEDISDDQYSMIVADARVNSWVTGKNSFQVVRRREYGPGAQSTTTKVVNPGRFWTDQPVDATARREIEARMEKLDTDFGELKRQILPIRDQVRELKTKTRDLQKEIEEIRVEKTGLQKLQGAQRALPEKIQREEEALQKKQEEGQSIRERIKTLQTQHDHAALRKVSMALQYKEQVESIRLCHEGLLEAEIRLIEAHSDVESLEERNIDIIQRRDQERHLVQEIKERAEAVRDQASRALKVCQQIRDAEDPETCDRLSNYDAGTTVESLQHEIAGEESKLDFIHASNPNAIAQYEKFDETVKRLKAKVAETDERLQTLEGRINSVRGKWEPELDKLISEISDAFSYNFEQIGCAGEVDVHKDDDFENWAIQIKVKFRENETLQILDAHRQSGGERSVSTIFYLMALQSLARSPFRVVDEINQGMDPRNERMVHERMVEIACKEHTSQYFLITPKLLTNLRYDRRMKVLCIASGEYMPQDYRRLDVSKVISRKRAVMAAS